MPGAFCIAFMPFVVSVEVLPYVAELYVNRVRSKEAALNVQNRACKIQNRAQNGGSLDVLQGQPGSPFMSLFCQPVCGLMVIQKQLFLLDVTRSFSEFHIAEKHLFVAV